MPNSVEVYDPVWYLAPPSICEPCRSCQLCIQPGELIAEMDDEFIHRTCWDWAVEDMQEGAL